MPSPVSVPSNTRTMSAKLAGALSPEGATEYQRLLRLITATRGRFALFPIESDLRFSLREAFLEGLRLDLSKENLRLQVLRLTRVEWDITARLTAEIGPADVLAVIGLEETPGIAPEGGSNTKRPLALAVLNHLREAIRGRFPVPLLVWCDPQVYLAMQEHAPDFFDHFTALFSFLDSVPEPAAGFPTNFVQFTSTGGPPRYSLSEVNRAALRFYDDQVARWDKPGRERARALLGLAESLWASRGPEDHNRLERAMGAVHEALPMLATEDCAVDRAATYQTLGTIFASVSTGNRAENLHRAIACYESALRAFTEPDYPFLWARTQNDLGNIYSELPTGERGENLHHSIGCYESALRVFTKEDSPLEWAGTQNNLAIAYANLPTGNRLENLRQSLVRYESVLSVFTEKDFPIPWAITQRSMGDAYALFPSVLRGESLRRAIGCYESALRVFSEGDTPTDWAATQNNLGNAHADLPTGDQEDNVRRAINSYEASLRVFTESANPLGWAKAQMNLGNAYARLPSGRNQEHLDRAVRCYQSALRIWSETDFPLDWAMTQNNLGNAYANLPTGDLGENLTLAVGCFRIGLARLE